MTGADSYPPVTSYIDSSVSIVTLNRSREGNRLNPALLHELTTIMATTAAREDIRAVLIRSNGKTFCHGMDLSALRASGWDQKRIEETVGLYCRLLYLLYTFPKPVIAVVQGDVKAGGVGLTAAADYVLGTDNATFELAEVFFGLIPANVLPFLQGLRLSPGKARALILTARKLNALEAVNLGLLDELYQEENLEKKTKELLKRLLMFSPRAFRETKDLTLKLSGRDLPGMLELTKKTLTELLMEKSIQQGIESFLEGGLPPWAGRFRPEHPLIVRE